MNLPLYCNYTVHVYDSLQIRNVPRGVLRCVRLSLEPRFWSTPQADRSIAEGKALVEMRVGIGFFMKTPLYIPKIVHS